MKVTSKVSGVYNKNRSNLTHENVKYVSVNNISDLVDEYQKVFFVASFIPRVSEDYLNDNLYSINVGLLKKCLNYFPSARFILASSVSVYGEPEPIITEKTRSYNVNNYGLSKLWSENILKSHHSYSILRISSMYGVGMKINTFIPLIICQAIEKGKIIIFGDGSRKQNYIHVSDVVNLMLRAASCEENRVFLATDLESYSNADMARNIQKIIKGMQIEFVGEDNSQSYFYNPTTTYKRLGYTPQTSLFAELENLIRWIRK